MGGKVFVCFLMISMVSSLSLQQTDESQVLGFLKQADATSAGTFPSYIMDLLPELIAASTQIKSNDVVDTLMAYMPFARKIMAGQSVDGKLTVEQEKLLRFTNKVVPPMMRFVEGISGGSSLTDLPLNATPDDDFTNVMLKMLPDISTIINELKAKYGGWPGTDKAVEITNAFLPLTRKAMLYQAELEGRQITEEENKYLTFSERVVPSVMEYSKALYFNSAQPGQEFNIGQLVMSAVEDLHKISNRAPLVPSMYHQGPVSYVQSPVSYAQAPVSYVQAPVSYARAPVSYVQAPASYAKAPVAYVQYAFSNEYSSEEED